MGLYGRKYVWIVPGFFGNGWWKEENPNLDCSAAEILQATEEHFEFNFAFLNPKQERGMANITSGEWKAEFDRRSEYRVLAGTEEAPSAYDTVWAMTLAMNATHNDLLAAGE